MLPTDIQKISTYSSVLNLFAVLRRSVEETCHASSQQLNLIIHIFSTIETINYIIIYFISVSAYGKNSTWSKIS